MIISASILLFSHLNCFPTTISEMVKLKESEDVQSNIPETCLTTLSRRRVRPLFSSGPARWLMVRRPKTAPDCSLRDLRTRIDSVKNTRKITEAMKLVAAAKVQRAQEAVVNAIPFSKTLVEVLYSINEQLQVEDVDVPLTNVRPVKKVALVNASISFQTKEKQKQKAYNKKKF
ncbi:hypothetical protein SSX86_020151 [Deinandra increscens subsp. villosa]|uniref:F-ATPase gamma subunit n=1 Tax=Deinandra increscens subsp. villosa TaxID=3103831 RepID=A0AAP0CMH5_9ASTR